MGLKGQKIQKTQKKESKHLTFLKDKEESKHLTFLKDRVKANKIYLHKCYQVVSRQDADILQFNIIINFCWTSTVESSEIPKDPRTDREKLPTGPFVLVTPFDVDRGRSLVKSVSFTLANREKSSTNRENSLVRTAHTETSVSTTLAPSVTPISYERTSRTPTPILSPMQIDLDKEIDYYNNNDDNDDDNEEHNDNRDKSDNCDKSDNREPLPKSHIVEGERYLTVKEFMPWMH